MEQFSGFHESSKVWIYTSPRPFTSIEIDFIRQELISFCSNWAAHGSQLKAGGDVLDGRFIVLIADESQTTASGCSIDTSVRFIKQLSQELGLDLFNRMYFYSKEGDKIHFSELKDSSVLVYNSLATSLRGLRMQWLVNPSLLLTVD
jgi:hypothetical protein